MSIHIPKFPLNDQREFGKYLEGMSSFGAREIINLFKAGTDLQKYVKELCREIISSQDPESEASARNRRESAYLLKKTIEKKGIRAKVMEILQTDFLLNPFVKGERKTRNKRWIPLSNEERETLKDINFRKN